MLAHLFAVIAALFSSPTSTHAVTTSHVVAVRPQVIHAAKPAAVRVAKPKPVGPVLGADVSWPQCNPMHNMPLGSARYVVIGATNGPAFTTNPCLTRQAAWARQRHLWASTYVVLSFPTRSQVARYGGRSGGTGARIARVGAAEARHALAALRSAHAPVKMVWLDIETVNGRPWSAHASLNELLIRGAQRVFQKSHLSVGIYSYKSAWDRITGGWQLHLPTWVPTGSPYGADAVARCHTRSFSGGPILMTQWTDGARDYDVTCAPTHLTQLFHK